MRYPVVLELDDNGTILVGFPDFPEAHTFGDDREEALQRAPDALATVIDAYIRARRPLPAPSAGGDQVQLPALMSVKVDLYKAMQAASITKSELARRLDVHLPQVDRLLDLGHSSRVEQLEAAATAIGAAFTVTMALLPALTGTSSRDRHQRSDRLVRTAAARSHPSGTGVLMTSTSRAARRERAQKKR